MKNPYQPKAVSHTVPIVDATLGQYNQFIERIVHQAKVFALYQDGWALCATPNGQQTLAIWQSKSLAQLLQRGVWEHYQIQEIPLIPFIEKMIPFVRKQEKKLSINLTPLGQNILVSGDKFLLDLKIYLYQLYSMNPQYFQNGDIPLPRRVRLHETV